MKPTVHARPDATTGLHQLEGEVAGVAEGNRTASCAPSTLRGLSPRTVRAYAMDLVVVLRWLQGAGQGGGPLQQESLTEATLLEFVAVQREEGAQPRSINRLLTTVRLLYRFVTGTEMPRGAGVSTPSGHYRGRGRDRNLGLHKLSVQRRQPLRVKVPHTLVEPLTPMHVARFLARCQRYRDVALVYLMLLCGLRSREVLSLRVRDVGLTDAHRVWGKGGKERALPLPPLLVQLVQDYLHLERPDATCSDALFLVLQGERRGRPMTPEGLRNLFRHRRKEAALAPANPHRFRHTFGADMARAGVRLTVLQRMMGHAHAETTVRYINLADTDVLAEYRRASERIHSRYAAARRASGEEDAP